MSRPWSQLDFNLHIVQFLFQDAKWFIYKKYKCIKSHCHDQNALLCKSLQNYKSLSIWHLLNAFKNKIMRFTSKWRHWAGWVGSVIRPLIINPITVHIIIISTILIGIHGLPVVVKHLSHIKPITKTCVSFEQQLSNEQFQQ